mgnify:CR=1 FL=1
MEAKTRNLLIFGGIFLGLAIGGTIWYVQSQKSYEGENKDGDGTKTDDNLGGSSTDTIKVTTNPTADDILKPTGTGKPPVSMKKVYANFKDTSIYVPADNSKVDANNPLKVGAVVRKTEKKGELLGNYLGIITIYANPFVVFTDSYSGRKVIVSKVSVTVK